MSDFESLIFSTEFFDSYAHRRFTPSDRAAILKAMMLLDANERHPSLRVHKLEGNLAGTWSASASDSLRLLFERAPDGKKRMKECTKHYDD
jgi:mRNA-degrading endonuclease YafQ of YafQ-DinJ toxin-antitoxin module